MNRIEYLEIRRSTDRQLVGILDNFASVIWQTDYYTPGAFEIYTQVNPTTIGLLKVDNYVTRPDDDNIGIIEDIKVQYDEQNGNMIIATGHFCKILLNRRLIYKLNSSSVSGKLSILPTISRGLVEVCARTLVSDHIISSKYPERNVDFIKLGEIQNIQKRIRNEDGDTTQKQTSYANLLQYTDSLLQAYELGAYMRFDRTTRDLVYQVFEGIDRSRNNSDGNQPIIFSQDFGNLIASSYSIETQSLRNTALIGGEGEGVNRFCTIIGDGQQGLNRREIWVDAQSQSIKDDNEQEYTEAQYLALLSSAGQQALAEYAITQAYDAEININNVGYQYRRDFNVGDRVSVEDNFLGVYLTPRITQIIESQDEQGYNISIKYDSGGDRQ